MMSDPGKCLQCGAALAPHIVTRNFAREGDCVDDATMLARLAEHGIGEGRICGVRRRKGGRDRGKIISVSWRDGRHGFAGDGVFCSLRCGYNYAMDRIRQDS